MDPGGRRRRGRSEGRPCQGLDDEMKGAPEATPGAQKARRTARHGPLFVIPSSSREADRGEGPPGQSVALASLASWRIQSAFR